MAALIRWEQLTPEAANLGRATDLRGSEAGGIRGLCLCVCPCGCTVDIKARRLLLHQGRTAPYLSHVLRDASLRKGLGD